MLLSNILATPQLLLVLSTLAASSSDQCATPPEYDASQFLETFKDGYVALTSFYNYDACTLLNRTTLSDDNTMAEYVVMSRKRDQTDLTTYKVSFKAEAFSSKVHFADEDNNVKHITLAYAQYGKCAVFQDDSNPEECVLYAYTDATDDEFNACSEHFLSNCDKELWGSLGPQQCKDGERKLAGCTVPARNWTTHRYEGLVQRY